MDAVEEKAHLYVAGEVRAALARRRISGRRAARDIGWDAAYIHRRLDGRTPFDVNDLVTLAAYLDVPVTMFFEGVSYGTTTELSLSGHETIPVTSTFLTLGIADDVPVVPRAA